MMRIQLVSDLHVEMRDEALQALPGWRDPDAAILVMAGDICNLSDPASLRAVIRAVSGWERVIYVPGNHEFYEGSPASCVGNALDVLRDTVDIDIALTPGVLHVLGQRFICGTMWYRRSDVAALPGAVPDQGRWHQRSSGRYRTFNDFRFTKDLAPWVYEQNLIFQNVLQWAGPDDIVITHHLPSASSTPEQFRNEIDNCFFVCDQEAAIRAQQPKLWLHGHTHTPFDYAIGHTRVVANPLGYRNERRIEDYKPLTLEIP